MNIEEQKSVFDMLHDGQFVSFHRRGGDIEFEVAISYLNPDTQL
jgi:hypothetical protein